MGRKKRPSAQNNQQHVDDPKKARTSNETGESYLVKKYRPTKIYAAMESFVKYTKSHRMLDATYVRWRTGVTPDKPFVFSTRVGGVDLGWGKGKTRESAMDCACRAAFALVAAHGYNNFPLDDDCLMQAPTESLPPPPPPPPAPTAYPVQGHGIAPIHLPPLPNGMPPLPHGLPPGLPPLHGHPPPLPSADLIPQAKMVSDAAPTASSLSSTLGAVTTIHASPTTEVPVASSIGNSNPAVSTVSISLNNGNSGPSSDMHTREGNGKENKKKLKGGLTLVYDPDRRGTDDISMEETRALLPRYQKLLSRASSIANTAL